jgi:hypothetical protein
VGFTIFPNIVALVHKISLHVELLLEILLAGVRESEFDERVPAGDFLFHVPY